jgi:hypothetical protein
MRHFPPLIDILRNGRDVRSGSGQYGVLIVYTTPHWSHFRVPVHCNIAALCVCCVCILWVDCLWSNKWQNEWSKKKDKKSEHEKPRKEKKSSQNNIFISQFAEKKYWDEIMNFWKCDDQRIKFRINGCWNEKGWE